MNIVDRAFQSVAHVVDQFVEPNPRVRTGRLFQVVAAATSVAAFFTDKGLLDFLGLQSGAFFMALTGCLIVDPEEVIDAFHILTHPAMDEVLLHSI